MRNLSLLICLVAHSIVFSSDALQIVTVAGETQPVKPIKQSPAAAAAPAAEEDVIPTHKAAGVTGEGSGYNVSSSSNATSKASSNATSWASSKTTMAMSAATAYHYYSNGSTIHGSAGYKAPIMMFTHGCSESTAGIHTLQELLRAHGMNSDLMAHGELIKSLTKLTTPEAFVKEFLQSGMTKADETAQQNMGNAITFHTAELSEKVEILVNWAKEQGVALTFKNELTYSSKNPDMMQYLKNMGARPFLFTRTNLVDVLKCRIEDFCNGVGRVKAGYRVDANGEEIPCGFRGRSNASNASREEDRVWLDPEVIEFELSEQQKNDKDHRQYLSGNLFSEEDHAKVDIGRWNYKEFAAEDLLSFEYGEAYDAQGMRTSTQEWVKLLGTVGIHNATFYSVQTVLKSLDQYPAPLSHKYSIANYDDIKKALQGTQFKNMLREDDQRGKKVSSLLEDISDAEI